MPPETIFCFTRSVAKGRFPLLGHKSIWRFNLHDIVNNTNLLVKPVLRDEFYLNTTQVRLDHGLRETVFSQQSHRPEQ